MGCVPIFAILVQTHTRINRNSNCNTVVEKILEKIVEKKAGVNGP